MIQVKKTILAKKLEQKFSVDFMPKRTKLGDAGFDLRACIEEPLLLKPGQIAKILTGVHIWIGDMEDVLGDDNELCLFAGLYLPRSSCPGFVLTNTVGLLDSQFQGESLIKCKNTSDVDIIIEPCERLVQLVIIPVFGGNMYLVDEFNIDTKRGDGFGSSGKF